MKKRIFAIIALLTLVLGGASAQSAVGVGEQVTSESAIQEGVSYVLQSQAANVPYIADMGTYYAIPNNNPAKEDCVYQFISNGDGTWKIKSVYTGKYWGVPVYGQELQPADEAAAGKWSLNFNNGIAYPTAPDADNVIRGLDRSSSKLWGFTTGTGVTKQVKIFKLNDTPPVPLSDEILEELNAKTITVATNYANNLTTGQWYVMFDRGTNPGAHGYLYEKVSEHALWNSSTVPSGTTTSAAKYLVRLSDAGDGKYYVQTGYGNYFGAFAQGTKVAVTSLPEAKITIGKIANTDGHFYLQSSSSNIILDANDVRSGDATVVGWGNTIPTTTGGNNDWAFYPVTLEDFDPNTAIYEEDVTVTRGYQTCGRGNENSLMLRIDLTPSLAISNATINVSLNEAAVANLSNIYIHETTAKEFIANIPSSPIATATVDNTVSFNIGNVSEGLHHFWLCATVKDDAELGAILEATLTGIDYTCNSSSLSLDVPASKTPSRQGMKVFDQQHFVFRPTSDNCRFYRIPAMIVDQNGDIVVSIDKRYNSNSDLGGHKIDVISMRSEDGGRTWKDKVDVAVGDGYTMAYYGYGDPGLARAENGDLICLMAAGSKRWGADNNDGMKYTGLAISSNNGKSWTLTKNLFDSSKFYDEYSSDGKFSMSNYFTTSGKGLTTNDGVIMFATNCRKVGDGTNLVCIIYSTDNGNSWRLSKSTAYTGGDESKLEQLNDGSLLLSVRQGGNRGWNTATYSKNADGTITFKWGEQYRSADISGNACNADLIYYSRTTKGAKRDIMLHSYINTGGRESLQLAMSIDGGKSWHDVYNIQPNGSCYSTMQVLNDGSLAILYEDESYSADNGFAITYVTITKDQINEWCDELLAESETPGVIIVEHGKTTNSSAPFVTWQETTSGNWAKKFTTNAATGVAGVVVSTDSYAFNRQTSYGQRILAMKPTAAGAQNDVFTITAPDGYLVEGYSIGGYFGTGSETYTLTAENGSSVAINKNNNQQNPPNFLNVTGINAKSTTFKMSNNNTANTSFAVITQFIVYLKKMDKKSLVLLDDDREVEYPNADRITDNLEVQAVDVTLHGRTLFKDNSWNTLCLPFAINDFAGTPLEDAEVRSLENASFNNGTLTLNFSEGLDAIEAGKPYIVRWTSGDDIKNPVFTNVQFDNTDGQLVFDNVGLIFKGTFTPFVFEAQDKSKLYMGNENKLLYPKKTMAIKAFRAFFDLGDNLVAAESSAAAGAKEITNFVLNFGETTEIGASLNDNGKMTNDCWYSIDGRRLNGKPTQKGVYIVNGKRIVK